MPLPLSSLAGLVLAALLPPPAQTVSLKQLSVAIDPKATDSAEATAKVAAFERATRSLTSCDDVEGVARDLGASVITNANIPLETLPQRLRELVATMPVGTATPLFGTREEGAIRSLVLCGRSPAQ